MTLIDDIQDRETNPINYRYNKVFGYDGKQYMLYYYFPKDFRRLWKEVFPKHSWLRRLLSRGFTDGHDIFLMDESCWYSRIGHDKLIVHEIAHIEKLHKHTWKPTIMNPMWIFRWTWKPMKKRWHKITNFDLSK